MMTILTQIFAIRQPLFFAHKTHDSRSKVIFNPLQNCAVPETNLLPKTAGLKSVFACLNFARYGVACSAVGSAITCYQAARAFALKRAVFDKPIASYQLVQDRLVRMVVEITKAQLLNYHLGRFLDENRAKHTPTPEILEYTKITSC